MNTQRAITPKVEKPELRFMCSARRLMVFNVCVKFHENMSSGFKVMERTRKLLTDTHTHTHTHTHRKDENIIPPWHTSYAGGITRTVRKSDYTPTLALPKHMAGILDEKCREKAKYREQQIGECPFSIPCYYPLL